MDRWIDVIVTANHVACPPNEHPLDRIPRSDPDPGPLSHTIVIIQDVGQAFDGLAGLDVGNCPAFDVVGGSRARVGRRVSVVHQILAVVSVVVCKQGRDGEPDFPVARRRVFVRVDRAGGQRALEALHVFEHLERRAWSEIENVVRFGDGGFGGHGIGLGPRAVDGSGSRGGRHLARSAAHTPDLELLPIHPWHTT